MINPLQAMQAARASNQNRASAIQPTGAVNQSQNLQRQQLNTGQIGTRMDGVTPQMLAVDPNMYADRKQQRDFTALNQERQRQHAVDLNALQNQQAIAREETRYKNALDTAKQTDQLNRQTLLDAEARAKLAKDKERKDKLEQAKALQILKDDQFADLREPAGRIFQRKNAWDQGAAVKYQRETYSQLLNQQAYALGDPTIRKAWVEEQNKKLGPNQTSRFTEQDLEVDSPDYLNTAMRLLRSNPNFATIEAKAQKDASAATYAQGKQINDSFNATLASITKLGYSPSLNNAVQPQFPVNVDRDSGLLVPPMESKTDKTDPNNNNLILNNPDGTPGAIPEAAKEFIDNTSVEDVAKVGGGAFLAKQTIDTLSKSSAEKIGNNISKDIKEKYPNAKNMRSLKIEVFKDAQARYAPDLKMSDDDIAKMNVDDMRKKLAANQKGWASRMAKKGFSSFKDSKGNPRMPDGLKKSLKIGAYGTAFITGLEWLDSREYTPAQVEEAKKETAEFNATQSAIVQIINDEVLADQEINATLNTEGGANPLTPR